MKTTDSSNINAQATSAVRQLVGRGGYTRGNIMVRTTDYDVSIGAASVGNAEQLFTNLLGTQWRSLRGSTYQEITTTAVGPDNRPIWSGTYTVDATTGQVTLRS